jgi:hypothetical protein
MDLQNILQQLQQHRSQLDAAINALDVTSSAPRRGRPPKSQSSTTGRGGRRLSAAARARISAAQRARWAKQKRESTPKKARVANKSGTGKKGAGRSGPSAAGRKRLSELMKKRWAERKKQAG